MCPGMAKGSCDVRGVALRLLAPSPSESDLFGDPDGTLLTVEVAAERLRAEWIGGEQLMLVRSGVIIAQTEPHTLRAMMIAGNQVVEPVGVLPDPIVRNVGLSGGHNDAPPGLLEHELRTGDRIVAMGSYLGRAVEPSAVARSVSTAITPRAAADAIIDDVIARSSPERSPMSLAVACIVFVD